MQISLSDNGGRRVEGDRRQLVNENYSPERRSGVERRVSGDRRIGAQQVSALAERRGIQELLSA
jgi:hypothetical protein